MSTLASRVLLAAASAGLALLAAEAALRAAGAPGLQARLARLVEDTHADAPPPETGADTTRSDPLERLYVAHPDPAIGLTFRPDSALRLQRIDFRSDSLGLRAPPGPTPPVDAFRVVVLGDSVAFGYGVADGQTLAAQLAAQLGGEGRPVAARSVAVPGWTLRDAATMLDTQWDALAADLVIWLPQSNDLNNAYSMDGRGRRVISHDPATRDPALRVSVDIPTSLAMAAVAAARAAGTAPPGLAALGPLALEADLSPESALRYDDAAAVIASLAGRLRDRGATLVVALWNDQPFEHLLRERLVARLPDLPLVPLFASYPPEFQLPDDPHPNGASLAVVARWLVDALTRRRLLPDDVRPVPRAAVPATYAAQRATLLDAATLAERCRRHRLEARGALQAVLEPDRGRGALQVFGGVHATGLLERRALALLPRGDGQLRVRLAALPGHPELLPQRVTVDVDGEALGEVLLLDETPVAAEFALPPGSEPVEVGLSASASAPVSAGPRQVEATARLLRLATADG